MSARTRYRFVARIDSELAEDGVYVWQAHLPNDSRVEEVRCPVDWFWLRDVEVDE